MWRLASALTAALLLAACSTTPDKQAEQTSTNTETQVETQSSGDQSGTTQGEKAETGDVQQEELDEGPEPGTQQDLVVDVGDRVFFAFDKSSLSDEAKQTIERLAAWMRENADTTITIEGHADERGTREYNLALGARRASAVKDYLVALGINPNRLQTVSYGEERPAVLGSNEEAWAKNRRAVFKVDDTAAGTT
ncbi:peptidoglycan-associated lipoprotein [Limimonas halophila]|uniref:Peptidoglycan-associated lipoprotein n=1 Tax=Limimonas halophila TaxID=1082479 RepID=A0A1G7LZZ8_9PROT|nr:peptidoglycan-associated lipoprotein Pal [Limimonas halophila]SDF55077.1 peptidoglycan-associated lipoprotein [Limimonas halophila]